MIKDYPWSTPQLRKLDVPVCPQPIQSPVTQQAKRSWHLYRPESNPLHCPVWGIVQMLCSLEACCEEVMHSAGTARRASRWCRALSLQMVCSLQVTVDGKPWPLDASGKPILKT